MTPRLRSFSLSDSSFKSAPRSLKLPVACMISYLRKICAPESTESFGASTAGVRITAPSNFCAAALIVCSQAAALPGGKDGKGSWPCEQP